MRSRQDSQILANWLQNLSFRVAAYHAGLPTKQRRAIEQDWLTGKIQFAVCTSAFGMGIDKPDCAWVIHYHVPELLTEYLQEVGRSGRNGQTAQTLTLISEKTGWLDPTDKQRRQFFQRQLEQQFRQAQQLIPQLPSQGAIANIQAHFPQGEIALSILHSLGLVVWQDPFHYRKLSSQLAASSGVNLLQKHQKQMQQYLQTKQCRWQFLLKAFGFQDVANLRCGQCDNCQKYCSR